MITTDLTPKILRQSDPDGSTTYFTFDELDRQSNIRYPDGAEFEYTYDEASSLAAARDERGWTYFAHDPLNRMTREQAPDGTTIYFTYDAVGRRTQVAYLGNVAYYTYDESGRIVSVDGIGGATYYGYDPARNVRRNVLPNGCYTYWEYDPANRVTSIKNCKPDGSPLAYFIYEYDAASRITAISRENGNVIYYGYDDADRLTSETWRDASMQAVYAFEWDYDAVGNRTYQNRNGAESYYSYDAANQLTTKHDLDGDAWSYYSYDCRGSCVAIQEPDGATYFQYNHANLVTSIQYKDGVANYFWYDAQLRRYAIQDSSGLSYFTWDQNGMNLLAERDAYGSLTAEYTHGYIPFDGIGSLVAARKTESGATYYQYPICDHRGSVFSVVNKNGEVVDSYEYDAWGEVLSRSEAGAKNRFGYQSNWVTLDDSGGEICLSPSRLYCASVGRFLGTDPGDSQIGEAYTYVLPPQTRSDTAHLCVSHGYVYCRNLPMGLVDPSGMFDIEWASGGTPWTGAEKDLVIRARDRLRARLNLLVPKIGDEITMLQARPCPFCYQWLISKCAYVRSVLLSVIADIDSGSTKLRLSKAHFMDPTSYAYTALNTIGMPTIGLNNRQNPVDMNFFLHGGSVRKANKRRTKILLHEFTHLQGTKDPENQPNLEDWNNAHMYEFLMFQPFGKWTPYAAGLQDAEQRHQIACCCTIA